MKTTTHDSKTQAAFDAGYTIHDTAEGRRPFHVSRPDGRTIAECKSRMSAIEAMTEHHEFGVC